MNKISAVILTKNSERYLSSVLEGLALLDEVVILDNGSTDNTLSIAKSFANVSIHSHEFIGFGGMKQLGGKLARNDWILSIDSDEIASPLLIQSILHTPLNPQICYSYEVKNFFNGRHIRSCGWSPDTCIGLYHRGYVDFNDALVHEKLIPLSLDKLTISPLEGHICHYPYANCHDFLAKMQKYSDLFANDKASSHKSTPTKALLHAFWRFIKNYFLQKGILEGYEGFIISVYNAQCTFWKYIKLYETNKKLDYENSYHQT